MKIKTCGFECKNGNQSKSESNNEKSLHVQEKKHLVNFALGSQINKSVDKIIETDKNIVNFNLIKSICNMKYFKGK
jgi:hypothetical protein